VADPTDRQGEDDHPSVDFSEALGEAGHEVEDLGATDKPDDGPLVTTSEDVKSEDELEAERDLTLNRAQYGVPRTPPE
jgi:hypothetical protein